MRTNKEVERAVQFVLGDTLIVDTLEDARRVAYEDAPRATQGRGQPKLVTLLGERIGKNGSTRYCAQFELGTGHSAFVRAVKIVKQLATFGTHLVNICQILIKFGKVRQLSVNMSVWSRAQKLQSFILISKDDAK